jgi:hypothetical protein
MLGAVLKKAFAFNSLLNISFRDDTTSSAPEDRVMNITGVMNYSLGTIIKFNASEISNFAISNATTDFASTVALPISLLPLFDSATAASELQGPLSTVYISVSTSSIADSHRPWQSSSVISSTNHAVVIHSVSAASAVEASIDGDWSSNSTASHSSPASLNLPTASAKPTSQDPIKLSARSTGSSYGTVSYSLALSLGLSKTSAELMKTSTKPTVSSANFMTTPSKLAVTHTNHTTVLNHETANGQVSSTISSHGFEIVTSSDVRGTPTASTKYCWDQALKSYDQPGSLVNSSSKHLPVCTHHSASSIAGHSREGNSSQLSDEVSTPVANFSRISALDASVDKTNHPSVGLGKNLDSRAQAPQLRSGSQPSRQIPPVAFPAEETVPRTILDMPPQNLCKACWKTFWSPFTVGMEFLNVVLATFSITLTPMLRLLESQIQHLFDF